MSKLAALDLGSNSFHLLDATCDQNGLCIGTRIKDKVQIRAGLDSDHNMSQSAINRGLDCLKGFRTYIETQDIQQIAAVGTNALRIALNSDEFLIQAEEILQTTIRVISGKEEAQLIFNGVRNELDKKEPGFVIDIGGGSTEFAIGDKSGLSFAESLEMGCVSFYQRFFADGKIYTENVRAAEKAARLEIEPHLKTLTSTDKSWIAGTSGTLQSIALLSHHVCGDKENVLRLESIDDLEKRLILTGHINAIQTKHLDTNRREILPAGLAIVRAIFDVLNIKQIQICQAALCEGLLLDMCEKS